MLRRYEGFSLLRRVLLAIVANAVTDVSRYPLQTVFCLAFYMIHSLFRPFKYENSLRARLCCI